MKRLENTSFKGVGKCSKWRSYWRECVDDALGLVEIEEEAGEEGR